MIANNLKKILILVFLSSFLLVSCSKEDDKKSTSEAKKNDTYSELNKRVEKRWTALIAKDWETAYLLETPNYRKKFTLDEYKLGYGGAVTWKSFKIISTNKVSDKATDVAIELHYLLSEDSKGMVIPTVFNERWLKSDTQWWHIMKD